MAVCCALPVRANLDVDLIKECLEFSARRVVVGVQLPDPLFPVRYSFAQFVKFLRQCIDQCNGFGRPGRIVDDFTNLGPQIFEGLLFNFNRRDIAFACAPAEHEHEYD